MFLKMLFQDWAVNPHDLRIRLVLVGFRLAQWIHRRNRLVLLCFSPYLLIYRVIVFWIFHMELHGNLKIGSRLRLFHGYCLVIHPLSCIGNDVTLLHGVTLGVKDAFQAPPKLGDHVVVGAYGVLIGPITVGHHAVIGAGAVVTKDVLPGCTMVGNPAQPLLK